MTLRSIRISAVLVVLHSFPRPRRGPKDEVRIRCAGSKLDI
jgi:hypothetical protein